ncbi:acyl-CoA dehydrogenase family protein [Nocardia sp. NPDC049149]|uniref:acyl-CoA dehydrogenase family protein n=1 Tax=Nocardia sp. NPDC049149 TaxID=3364315 RepID=UPI00370F982A
MSDELTVERAAVRRLAGKDAAAWDLAGVIPRQILRELGAAGVLCAELPKEYGGLGAGSLASGEFTAYVGSVCSSLRSVLTSHGMAAWTIQRLGTREQRAALLPELAGGRLAAVAFSESDAGSDLSAMRTQLRFVDDTVIVDGSKSWITAAAYADLVIVFGKVGDNAAAVIVPTDAPGVEVEKIAHPLGCRAAGHAHVRLTDVRLPITNVLGGTGLSLSLLTTTALAYGRMSVGWGCVGILRGCLAAVTDHARTRVQFGKPLAEHQLVSRLVAELYIAEQIATRACQHASQCWESGSPEVVIATVLAKHVSATQAMHGAASAMQVMASAGASDGHVVARAYRDAKLMEIIEGSSEICQLELAKHAIATAEATRRAAQ